MYAKCNGDYFHYYRVLTSTTTTTHVVDLYPIEESVLEQNPSVLMFLVMGLL